MSRRVSDYELLSSLLRYDPATGHITYTEGPSRGKLARATLSDQYAGVWVRGKRYVAHRVAWLLFHGEWPKNSIDHIDRNRSNNAIFNLREATSQQNAVNRTARGTCFERDRGLWRAAIVVNGKRKRLGRFPTEEQANAAYVEAHKRIHAEFSPYHEVKS